MNKFNKMLEKFMKDSNRNNKDARNRIDRKNGAKKRLEKKENKSGGNKS